MQHDTHAHDGTNGGANQADQDGKRIGFARGTLALQANHEGADNQAHAEGGTEVRQGGQLILLKVLTEATVVRQGQDGGVVGEEGGDHAQGGGAGKPIKGF